jgi:AcrR family transcriptional regulator
MNQTTPTRLISVATRLFADHGFDGTSVRDIIRAADANLGAITYHFGSKQALYEAVVQTAFAPVTDRLAEPAARGAGGRHQSGLDRVEAIMRLLFAHISANPHLQLLILRQIVQSGALVCPAKQTLGLILGEVTRAIRDGQADGSIREGDAVQMAVSVMSQPAYFGLIRRLLPERLSDGRENSVTTEELTEHAVRFVRAGLTGCREA